MSHLVHLVVIVGIGPVMLELHNQCERFVGTGWLPVIHAPSATGRQLTFQPRTNGAWLVGLSMLLMGTFESKWIEDLPPRRTLPHNNLSKLPRFSGSLHHTPSPKAPFCPGNSKTASSFQDEEGSSDPLVALTFGPAILRNLGPATGLSIADLSTGGFSMFLKALYRVVPMSWLTYM